MYQKEWSGYLFLFVSSDSVITTRLDMAVMEVNGFTESIACYLSEFSPLRQKNVNQHGVRDNSTSENIDVSLFNIYITTAVKVYTTQKFKMRIAKRTVTIYGPKLRQTNRN